MPGAQPFNETPATAQVIKFPYLSAPGIYKLFTFADLTICLNLQLAGDPMFDPLNPNIKIQILICCLCTFLIEVVEVVFGTPVKK